MSDFGLVVAIGSVWLGIGLVLSVVMGRRGHNSFGWLVLGTVMGPLAIVLAFDARRTTVRYPEAPVPVVAAKVAMGAGPVDVLVGYDGSTESVVALDAVVELLGERLGRLTVATVLPFEARAATKPAVENLRRLQSRRLGVTPELEVLHGHPSVVLRQHATEGGYELIAVGTRGAGFAKAILGSAASELARDSKIPVLLVGGHHS